MRKDGMIEGLTYIGTETLTVEEARKLENKNKVLKIVSLHLDGTTTYHVYMKQSEGR